MRIHISSSETRSRLQRGARTWVHLCPRFPGRPIWQAQGQWGHELPILGKEMSRGNPTLYVHIAAGVHGHRQKGDHKQLPYKGKDLVWTGGDQVTVIISGNRIWRERQQWVQVAHPSTSTPHALDNFREMMSSAALRSWGLLSFHEGLSITKGCGHLISEKWKREKGSDKTKKWKPGVDLFQEARPCKPAMTYVTQYNRNLEEKQWFAL